MTTGEIRKSRFNALAAKCFDEKTLAEVELKEIYHKKEDESYIAVFVCEKMLTHMQEIKINNKCNIVFRDYPKVSLYFDYSNIGLKEEEIHKYINEKLCNKSNALKPFLQTANSYFKDEKYCIDFKSHYAKDMFDMLGASTHLQEILQFNFDIHYAISLKVNEDIENTNEIDITIVEPLVVKHEKQNKKAPKFENGNDHGQMDNVPMPTEPPEQQNNTQPIAQNKPKKARRSVGNEIILGKNIFGTAMNIADIEEEMERACIEGDVFDIEIITCKNKSKLIIMTITDYTSTMQAKMFMKEKVFEEKEEKLKKGLYRIEGSVEKDKYQDTFCIMAKSLVRKQKVPKTDDEPEKRVELHLHTVMSAEDAMTNIKKVIDRACDYGHKAIAITDHGVVQAFPIADGYASKKGIDIIYGMEAYMTLDSAEAFSGTSDIPLTGSFVVADIETTGFNPATEVMTEIGAVRVVDGEITDKFTTFVDPQRPIPIKITQITGITSEMVRGAPKEGEALKMFKDFVGEECIIAHNAKFDMSFFKAAGKRHDISFSDNPVMDTLRLSQLLLPENKRHGLAFVTKHFNIPLEHHRALNDAIATAEVLIHFLNMMKAKGIKSTYEINSKLLDDVQKKHEKTYHVILLCKTKLGLKNLYKIVSYSHINNFYKRPRVPKSFIEEHREGLIIGAACEQGEVYKAALNDYSDKQLKEVMQFYDYLEIQPNGNNEFLVREGQVQDTKELEDINRRIIDVGKECGKLTVATCDVHFLDARDSIHREVIMTMKKFKDAHLQPPLYFRNTREMLDEFAYLGEELAHEVVVENTNKIYEMTETFELLPKETSFPKIENADELLWDVARKTARDMYGEKLPEIVENRLNKEMNSICKHGFAVLYYIAHFLIKDSLDNGFIVGSRGSVGSSFAATMTGVTEVNPLPPHYRCKKCKNSDFDVDLSKYDCGVDLPERTCPVCGEQYYRDGFDIPFETFLGLNADKVPDIDLNFSGDYQAKAHEFTIDYFGRDYVFRAGTISTIAEKTAIGYVKNYMEVNGLKRPNADVKRIAQGLIGVKRTTGQHPGGLVVVPKDKEVYDYTPIQRPANDMKSTSTTTHFDFDSLHDRLVKLDILGHDDPTMLKRLSDLTGIDATTVPLNDEKTMKLFSSIESLGIKDDKLLDTEVGSYGVPEFGTKFVRGVLTLTRPTTMSELIRISGLSHGADVWQGNADLLIKNGTCTLKEVIATRDDIMNAMVAYGVDHKLSFFTMEHVRKGKGLKPEMEKAMRDANMPEWFIESCIKISYMFPKGHAVAYVTMALRIAYYKVHYPKAYYATYFSIRAKNFDASYVVDGMQKIEEHIKDINKKVKNFEATANEAAMITNLELVYEMYQRGIGFLSVDLEKSEAKDFTIEEDGIRMPFSALPGVGENAAENLRKESLVKKYISKEDIAKRAKASKTVIDALDEFGCLKGLTTKNQISFFDTIGNV